MRKHVGLCAQCIQVSKHLPSLPTPNSLHLECTERERWLGREHGKDGCNRKPPTSQSDVRPLRNAKVQCWWCSPPRPAELVHDEDRWKISASYERLASQRSLRPGRFIRLGMLASLLLPLLTAELLCPLNCRLSRLLQSFGAEK